jgi:N-acylneuraminate cytidylyltransferase
MSTIAIIPARGGSKGIPRKNLVDFCGHPLVAWSIACAKRCPLVDAVYVSTDDGEIAQVAREYGAEVIARPAELSGDAASSESALLHACGVIQQQRECPRTLVFIQATSPLCEASDLTAALRRFADGGFDSLFSAAEAEDMLVWLKDDAGLCSLNYDHRARRRRQERDASSQVWIETGAFYILRTSLLLESGNRLGGRIGLSPVSSWKSFEIDSREGLTICEALMRAYHLDRTAPVRAGSESAA